MASIRNNIKTTLLAGSILAALGLSTAGCATDGSDDKDFFPTGERQVTKIEEAQNSAGARHDATLNVAQFDGAALNSLGQAKLDAIVSNLPDEGPVSIYVDVPTDGALAQARKDAVAAYLTNSHLTPDQFKLVDGPNPNTWTPSATALSDMSKTDTDAAAPSGGSGSAGGTPGTGGH
jgi:hypothetical protein